MSPKNPPLYPQHQKIDAGVKKAIAEALERHGKLGESIIWQHGKVVTIESDNIPPLKKNV